MMALPCESAAERLAMDMLIRHFDWGWLLRRMQDASLMAHDGVFWRDISDHQLLAILTPMAMRNPQRLTFRRTP